MTQDRELLELAARAYGLTVGLKEGEWFYCEHGPAGAAMYLAGYPLASFSPRADDGDALRLAVKRRINISHSLHSVTAWTGGIEIDDGVSETEFVEDEVSRESATRRAITRAAAEIGKAMQKDGGV